MSAAIRFAWRLTDGTCGACHYSADALPEAIRNIVARDPSARIVVDGQVLPSAVMSERIRHAAQACRHRLDASLSEQVVHLFDLPPIPLDLRGCLPACEAICGARVTRVQVDAPSLHQDTIPGAL